MISFYQKNSYRFAGPFRITPLWGLGSLGLDQYKLHGFPLNLRKSKPSRKDLLALIKPMAREYQRSYPDLAREAQLLAQITALYDELFAMDPDGEP